MLPSTDGAAAPFFSPDGQWVAFFGGGKLKKVAVSGGAAVTLCDATNGRGGSWADDGSIVFQPESTPGTPLMRVSAAGGAPSPLIRLADGEAMQRWPQMLPGSKAVLFTSLGTGGSVFDAGRSSCRRCRTARERCCRKAPTSAVTCEAVTLLYVQQGTLFAAPFDVDRLELTGAGVPAVESLLFSEFERLRAVDDFRQRNGGAHLWRDRRRARRRSTGWTPPARRRRCAARQPIGARRVSRPTERGWRSTSPTARRRTSGCTTGRETRCRV